MKGPQNILPVHVALICGHCQIIYWICMAAMCKLLSFAVATAALPWTCAVSRC